MPLSDIVTGGPACGPSNPLQSLGKRFGQDRSTQLDRFDAGRGEGSSGSGAQSFRAPRQAPQGPTDPAFFHQHPHQHAFDLQPLKGALPLAHAHPAPLDLHSAWEQRQAQRRSSPSAAAVSHPAHFDASFRHMPAAADSTWSREYSPGYAEQMHQQQTHEQQQQQAGSQFALNGMQHNMPHMNMMSMRGTYSGPMASQHGPAQYQQHHYQQQQQQQHQPAIQGLHSATDTSQWDTAFTSIEEHQKDSLQQPSASVPADKPLQQQNENRHVDPVDADEFARTAGRLVSTIEHETNDKFKQSNFLNLMRKIRDKQAGIHGTDIVENAQGEQPSTAALDKGKGKQMDTAARPSSQLEAMRLGQYPTSRMTPFSGGVLSQQTSIQEDTEGRSMLNDMWAEEDERSEAIERAAMERSSAFLGDGGDVAQRQREDEAEFAKYQNILGMQAGSAGAAATAFLQQQQRHQPGQEQQSTPRMEEDFDELAGADFVGKRWEGTQGRGVQGAQAGEWDALQKDWDTWQAGSAGLQPSLEAPLSASTAPQYRFHAYNPYVGSASSNVYQGSAAAMPADMQSVLEREAVVQSDPSNASAWLDLGIKQQENEREDLAIAALHRAIQIEPTLREAWLALAVSYTNEADRSAALEAIERWIEASPQYREIVSHYRADVQGAASKAAQTPRERHDRVTGLLMALARHGSMQSTIDADVQVALGVLFNASEDYDKAVDCFETALHVRPEDWLLYNRLGATLSNSGRSSDALRYYQQALELKPGFVRCHFNMSISCLNLKMYRDAASHIYTALLLQSESVDAAEAAGGATGASLGSGSAGIASTSLWETLRVACELMNRPDLAMRALERNLDAIDPSIFWGDADSRIAEINEDTSQTHGIPPPSAAAAGLSGAQDATAHSTA